MLSYIYNLNTWESEAGGCQAEDQPCLFSGTLSQKKEQVEAEGIQFSALAMWEDVFGNAFRGKAKED